MKTNNLQFRVNANLDAYNSSEDDAEEMSKATRIYHES
jgi:hypothetical protein